MKNISNYLDPSDTVLYEGVIRSGGMEDIFDESFNSFIKNWAEANEISDDLQVTYQVL
jgi:hypothetical protein